MLSPYLELSWTLSWVLLWQSRSQLAGEQHRGSDGAGCSPCQKWSHLLEVQESARPPAETHEHLKATWSRMAPGYQLPAGSYWPSQRGAALGLGSC